jgi:hypothetical protein
VGRAVVVSILPTLAVAFLLFVLAYDGGGYSLASRASTGIAVWWTLFLALGLGLTRFLPVPRPALVVGALLAALAAWTLASAFWAPSAEDVLEEFNRVLLYLGIFTIVVLATRWVPARAWVDGIALAIVAVAVIALASRFFPDLFSTRRLPEFLPSARNRLSFPVGYWNGLAILAGMAVPILLRLAVAARLAVIRGAAVAPLPAFAAVSLLASSRGGAATGVAGGLAFLALTARRWATLAVFVIVGSGVAAVLAVLLAREELVNGPLDAPEVPAQGRSAAVLVALVCLACAVVYGAASALAPRGLRIPRTVGWATAGVLAALVLAGAAAADPVERFEAFREPPSELRIAEEDFVKAHFLSGNGSGRWQFWETALDQFAAHPVGGGGAGSYEAWWAEHGSIVMFVRDAHSLYLETLAELGIPGLLLVVGLVAVGLATGVLRLWRAPANRELLAAATAAFAAYVVAAGIDWMWELTVVSLVAVVLLALVTGPATAPAPAGIAPAGRSARAPIALAIATAAIALVAISGHGIALLTAVQLEESEAAVARGNLVGALESARAARRVQPWAASPHLQLALVQEQAGALELARASIAEAIERNRVDWRLWLVQARLEATAGAVREAARSFLRAAELNPRSPLFADVAGTSGS